MSLREVANMTPAERKARADTDERAFSTVTLLMKSGTRRYHAFTKAASALGVTRAEVIAGYHQHRRRQQANAS